jgi:gentisate 1,2-dioxygenase
MTSAASAELDLFYRDLQAAHLYPLWNLSRELLPSQPQPRAVPWVWHARTMYPLAERAIRAIPVDRGGERRVLSLGNPGLDGAPYAAGTLWGALQCLGPGETAPAHRHTPGAIRFVLNGTGVFTTVNGDPCDMNPGDLVLTPSWNWHDHTNTGEQNMFWFDGLDLPMIEALDAVFFEPYPDFTQPADGPHNRSEQLFGKTSAGYIEGASQQLGPRASPLLAYRWADTDAELARLVHARANQANQANEANDQANDQDCAMVSIEFVNPVTGASALPTLSCSMHRLIPGHRTDPVQRTGNAIFVAFSGAGQSIVDGVQLDWSEGDMFVVPSWAAAEHRSAHGADLFALADTPVLRALGVYREQTLPGPQPVLRTLAMDP